MTMSALRSLSLTSGRYKSDPLVSTAALAPVFSLTQFRVKGGLPGTREGHIVRLDLGQRFLEFSDHGLHRHVGRRFDRLARGLPDLAVEAIIGTGLGRDQIHPERKS
jgi:hypothetical protein